MLTRLIVNADDFGLTEGVDTGVITAVDEGIVTSASLMVDRPAARHAGELAADRPALSLGLHLDLGEWVYADSRWVTAHHVVDLTDEAAVRSEVARQIDRFRDLTGADPTHLDSHQHVHRDDPVRAVVRRAGQDLRVPVRLLDPRITYCGAFYGQSGRGYPYPQGITVEALLDVLRGLPDALTELACHPGLASDLESVYRFERETEVQTLCDPSVRTAIGDLGIELCSFGDGSQSRGRGRAGARRPLDRQVAGVYEARSRPG